MGDVIQFDFRKAAQRNPDIRKTFETGLNGGLHGVGINRPDFAHRIAELFGKEYEELEKLWVFDLSLASTASSEREAIVARAAFDQLLAVLKPRLRDMHHKVGLSLASSIHAAALMGAALPMFPRGTF
ncbi:MAG: hypothetical protein WBO00_00310 [Steroidobacteraceae bacterium]